ncbi:MAG: hypothetical protein KGI50_05950 [Patescibacteria group bacterium]|nr:hypothetical protein [Patescibacteria group bacterium]
MTVKASKPNTTATNLPMPQAPLIDDRGMMSDIWWRYLLAIFNRTGGEGSPPSARDIAKAVDQNTDALNKNFNAMAVPTLAAALIQRVAQLEVMVQSVVQIKTTTPQTLPDIVQASSKTFQSLPESVAMPAKDILTDLYKFTSK